MIGTALAVLLALDESTEAEAIFRRMEAKTLLVRGRIRFEGDRHGEPEVRLRVAKAENLLRYDREDARIVSNGTQLRLAAGTVAAFPDLGEASLTMFSRWGIERGVEHHLWHDDHGKAVRRPLLEDFRILHREEVGPHKTVALSYVLSIPLPDSPVTNRWRRSTMLWIDEETLLPVRRLQSDGGRCIHWTTTETYDEIRFDEEMPADRFALPGFTLDSALSSGPRTALMKRRAWGGGSTPCVERAVSRVNKEASRTTHGRPSLSP